jgi:hypothetical protein
MEIVYFLKFLSMHALFSLDIFLLLTLVLYNKVTVLKPMCHLFRTTIHHMQHSCDVWRSEIVPFMESLGIANKSVVFITTMMCANEISVA